MAMMLSVSCDECDAYLEFPAGVTTNIDIDGDPRDQGWSSGPDGDYCPICRAKGEADE